MRGGRRSSNVASQRIDPERFRTRADWVSADLRRRLSAGEWAPGERLPTEQTLSGDYQASRATIRTALRDLDGQGLIAARRGSGTYVLAAAAADVSADLRRLESLSETIKRHGLEPTMEFRSVAIRPATENETVRLGLGAGAEVLATERALLVDGEVFAYSYDAIPRRLLNDSFDIRQVDGSMFALLDEFDVSVVTAHTDVHVETGAGTAWGADPGAAFLRLDQTHRDEKDDAVMESSTFFIEGHFSFSLVRTRD